MLQDAFNKYADNYDKHFTYSLIGKMQRERVYCFLEKSIENISIKSKALELNCGTGDDAIWLAKKGYEVEATDISGGMIDIALQKSSSNATNINFSVCSFEQIPDQFKNKKFALIFSNFGGLNCVNKGSLQELSEHIYELLQPGGKFIAIVMGRNCAWERFYFKRKNDHERAYRRLNPEGVETIIEQEKFQTWYYSPKKFADLFNKFRIATIKPVGLCIPPSYLEKYFFKKQWLLNYLYILEKMISPFGLFPDKADHYYIELIRD